MSMLQSDGWYDKSENRKGYCVFWSICLILVCRMIDLHVMT